ncbi:hypothetical protein [Spirosoma utsteinense]|uniref:Uncharacterized protein n=1 Tax=Spirosoma utsteinense TaxID=2585773 RepID=A0ABR6WAD8_9BACT|nr:hypothetical protein [Spirosoma utsteinense]MBC3783889.1 hypothetical protein [Spirosoma utsteinense]MBC3793531.1 hypothetical protein [Spirosoma utsteinense]
MQSAIPSSFQPARDSSDISATDWRLGIPVYVYAVVFSSFCVIMGLLWDIMWHMSIGRDGLFAPPHLVIYVGAVVSGLFSAYQILSLTLNRNHPGRAVSVPFWGVFYAPLGAMFCVWGALAMLTSAPFDDWWHNTYGLDVEILTPPHTILAIGIMTVQFGAIVGVLALQNKYRMESPVQDAIASRRVGRLKWLFAISAGLLLTMLFSLFAESMGRHETHEVAYYMTAAIILPLYLLAVGRASLLRWPITTIALLFMLFLLGPSWVLQYFPATPRLGPVLNPITTYQPFLFPPLLVIPAFAMDWLMHRFDNPLTGRKLNDWVLAGLLAVVFMSILLAVQWPFGEFLLKSPYARNGFFLSYTWSYDSPVDWKYRYDYGPWNLEPVADFALGFGKALVFATLSARIGLFWGDWMKRIAR